MNAIDIIEGAKSYYLLSNDKNSKPMFVGGRMKLEFALQGIDSSMIIATAGTDKRCLILVDFTTDETWALVQKGTRQILKIKAIN